MALSELRLRDAPSSADLARIAFVTPQAMNLVIRDLEQRGLIRRDPPSPGRPRVAHPPHPRGPARAAPLRPLPGRDRGGHARRHRRQGPGDARGDAHLVRPRPPGQGRSTVSRKGAALSAAWVTASTASSSGNSVTSH
ncbi:hypothetical protein [Nonomuraea salmonea]|uniref:hypothetical protein n=1 Tax=Nonomuraea salmonea TaxID=46181 RepID=UPI0031EA95CF